MASAYLKEAADRSVEDRPSCQLVWGENDVWNNDMSTLTEEASGDLLVGVEAGIGPPHSQEGLPPSQRDCAKASALPRTCFCSQVLFPSQVNAAVLPRLVLHPHQGANKNHTGAFSGIFPVPSKVFGQTFPPPITE